MALWQPFIEENEPLDFFLPNPSLSITSAPHRTRRSSTGPPLNLRVPSGARTGLEMEGCALMFVCVWVGMAGPDSRRSEGGRSISKVGVGWYLSRFCLDRESSQGSET